MLDMTVQAALLSTGAFILKLSPALIGSGVYLLFDNTVGWDKKTLGYFLLSVLFGWGVGLLLLETWKELESRPIAIMFSQAVASAIFAQIAKQVFENFGTGLKYALSTLWDKILSIIPSFAEIRELFKKDKPNG